MAPGNDYTHLLDLRPRNVARKLSGTFICLLSSHDILRVLKEHQCIIMAANTRIRHVIPGIMKAARDTEAVVAFELAKSESDLSGGYTGWVPQEYFEAICNYAEKVDFRLPFFIHGDHITVKSASEGEIESSRKLVAAQIDAGYTSFCIDASFNPLPDNLRISSELARPVMEAGLGLEVEVGEIKSAGQEGGEITTIDEAVDFISGLREKGIYPNLLAIYNGAKHGNYLAGEKIFIDLERTGEIYQAIKGFNVCIAQHGITGTPLSVVGKFAEYGIRKGNVGTQWQNIVHEDLPADLMDRMRAWAKENNKDIKMATKPFRSEIDGIPEKYRRRIEERAYQEATSFIKAFRAQGTAQLLAQGLK